MREGWEIRPLEVCISFIKNGANIKQTKSGLGYPITRIETLSGGKFNRDKMGYADIFDLGKYSGYVLNDGDILLSHINSKSYVGRSVVYSKEGDEAILHGMNLLRIILKKDVVPYFFQYYSLSHKFKKQITSIRKDAVNQSSVAIGDLKKIQIPVPSICEQERIVAELDCLSEVIAKKKQQLEELDKLAQSIFYDMFGNPVTNDMHWKTDALNTVAPQQQYGGTIPSEDGKFWLLNLDMVEQQTGRIIERVLFPKSEIGNSTTTFDTSNVLYSKLRPYLNKVVVPNAIGYATSELVPLRPKKDLLDRNYLAYLLRSKSFVDYISIKVAGAKMPRVSMDVLRSFPVILPPLSLQQSFAAKIEAIEQQKARINASIAETQKLFDYTMDKYFG